MTDINNKKFPNEQVDTILEKDIDFEGEMTLQKPLMIRGKVKGNITSEENLYIDETAQIEAQIYAQSVSVKGKLKGNIKATKRVELYSSAIMEGDITTPDVVIKSGCKFNGHCIMEKEGDS